MGTRVQVGNIHPTCNNTHQWHYSLRRVHRVQPTDYLVQPVRMKVRGMTAYTNRTKRYWTWQRCNRCQCSISGPRFLS